MAKIDGSFSPAFQTKKQQQQQKKKDKQRRQLI